MTMGRFKHTHLAVMAGISLFLPLFLAYSLYVDLSEIVLVSSDMSFEDPNDGDLSACQNEFRILVPMLSSNQLTPWTNFGGESSFRFSLSPLTPHTQVTPVIRC